MGRHVDNLGKIVDRSKTCKTVSEVGSVVKVSGDLERSRKIHCDAIRSEQFENGQFS